MAARNPRAAAELKGPPFPELLEYIWQMYQELDQGRSGNGFGFNPLDWRLIESWCRLTGRRLTRFELQAIVALDGRFLQVAARTRGGH